MRHTSLGSGGQNIPVRDGVGLARGLSKPELVVCREWSEIFHLGTVALLERGAFGLAVPAVTRCGIGNELESGLIRLVDLDNDVLPVVAVVSDDVAVEWVVLGKSQEYMLIVLLSTVPT
ncbi:hypothetical protein CH063_00008 [Colletotrichum higginsianum]|uniref:Uncharacterized protein n=1 Tax=Colletotrichum higginsianum (strain IMI 349063) TaxID=759273 RepID=H1V420_COLHI|nr:hypothetical protein CH063_00008 [Colletotrichum higginsianum]